MTVFTETDTFGIGLSGGAAPTRVTSTNVTELVRIVQDAIGTGWTAHGALTENLLLTDPRFIGYAQTLSSAFVLGSVLDRQYQGGASVDEAIDLTPALDVSGRFNISADDAMVLADQFLLGQVAALADGIGVHEVVNALLAIHVIEQLTISPTSLANSRFRAEIAELISFHSALGRFFGGEIHESVGFAPSTNLVYVGRPVLSDGIGLHDVLGQRLIWRVIEEETVGFADANALSAIYHAQISDVIQLSTAYISPGGGFTTWAMNTRTGAITEYTNYAFNSFARHGGSNLYVGANADGLFELDGDTNDGTKIIADIMSGFAQFAGSKFTAFKAAYLGLRGEGDFFLKLATGDGRSYTYKITAQSMLTTRVNLGKGLRARYFSFELISTGQDFDLESVEFVPITSVRRV